MTPALPVLRRPRRSRTARAICLLLLAGASRAGAQEPAAAAGLARVAGTVFDSVGNRPLAGALVRVVLAADPATGQSATTDSAGRFGYEALAAGTWLVSFAHPWLDSLALEAPIARVDVREAGSLSLTLATPSAATIIAGRCGSPVDPELGLLYGVVRLARDESPAAGASIALEWPEWVLQKRRVSTEVVRRVERTDSAGRFAVCGVPANSTVRAQAWRDGDSTGTLAVTLPPSGLQRHDFTVASVEVVAVDVTVDSTERTRVLVRRGKAEVTGRVLDSSGRPVPNAIVRVLGSGESTRSGDAGAFRVEGAAAGTQTVEARAIGFEPVRQTVELRDGVVQTVAFALAPQRVQLDTIRVMAGRAVDAAVTDFERRWRGGGGGTLLSGTQVRERAVRFVTDAMRSMNGVRVVPVDGYGDMVLMRSIAGGNCTPVVFVDGSRLSVSSGWAIDDFLPLAQVAAMEVYPRSSYAPAQYSDPTGGCGSIVLWSKLRFGGVELRREAPGRP